MKRSPASRHPFIPRYLELLPDAALEKTTRYYSEVISELKKCPVVEAEEMSKRLRTGRERIRVEQLRRHVNRSCDHADIGL